MPYVVAFPAADSRDIVARLVAIGFEIDGSSPEKLATVTRTRFEQMQKIIKEDGISIQ